MAEQPPGPPDRPREPDYVGAARVEEVESRALTWSVFNYLEQQGWLTEELRRARDEFMFVTTGKRVTEDDLRDALERHGPPPSWHEMADMLSENTALRVRAEAAEQKAVALAILTDNDHA